MNTLIMCGNTPVLEFNIASAKYTVLREDLLPFPLRGRLRPDGDGTQIAVAMSNYEAVLSWLANRTLLLSRSNAKDLYNLIRVDQIESFENRARLAIACKAVSVLDNYWVKASDTYLKWENVNIRHVSLNEVVRQVALHGRALTLQGSFDTPEFTTKGAYAKAWRRHPDGNLWLYKLGAKDSTESRIEVMCSNLLDKMNVNHVHYEAGEDDGDYVCMCPSMTSDSLSILSGSEFYSYCNVHGKSMDKELLDIDAESIFKMAIVDYLISNKDRHSENWGLYYKADTTEIIGCHPLFDHNNAFDINYMQNPDATYLFNGKPLRKYATYARKHVDFHFTAPITRSDFITQRQYDSFMSRAAELGIETVTDDWHKYLAKLNITDEQAELKRLMGVYDTTDEDFIKNNVAHDFL